MSTSIAPAPTTIPGRGRLGAYAWWQMRDYLINKGIATALIMGLLLFLSWTALRGAEAQMAAQGYQESLKPIIDLGFVEFMSNLILFGVLFATNGIVSEDRKFGYYKFYFSKPVTVAGFYGQKFAVHVTGLLLVAALMLGAHALAIEPRFPPSFLPVAALAVIGLAGIGFLVSAVFTLDWISLFAIYAAAQIGWTLYGDDPGIRGTLVRGLPPVHRLRDVYGAVARGEPLPMDPLWWIFLYGLACFFLGLVVVSRRRLATS
jgi:hypothetical protein